jgi:hypothetical protein
MALEGFKAYPRTARGWTTHAYNEEAFRHFLKLERRRAELSARSFVLLFAHLTGNAPGGARIAPAGAAALFPALACCVREVDFIGWYRDGHVIGAVLTQNATPTRDVLVQIAARVTRELKTNVPAHVAARLRVRAGLRPKVMSRAHVRSA